MDFAEFFRDMRRRPRMFLLSDSYLALVSFVTGCDAATEWRLLDGFGRWIVDRSPDMKWPNPLGWPSLVLVPIWPQRLQGTGDREWLLHLPPDVDRQAVDSLYELLNEFLTSRPDPFVVNETSGC
jgi:hypothetical protein